MKITLTIDWQKDVKFKERNNFKIEKVVNNMIPIIQKKINE